MKNINKFLSYGIIGCAAISITGCRDDWKGMNVDEPTIATATPVQLLSTAQQKASPFYYTQRFYGWPSYLRLSQMAGFTGSYTEGNVLANPGTSDCVVDVLKYVSAMDYELGLMDPEEAAKYEAYKQAVNVIAIFCGLQDSDTKGDIPYTEAGRALHGGTLTPKYDVLQDLYTLWNTELKNAVQVFKNPPAAPLQVASADIFFGADWSKWAKFASSLRVKLATRLIHRDLALAKSIVSEAVADGVMSTADDDLLFFRGDEYYGDGGSNTTVSYWGGAASAKVTNFLLKNRDPRLRFLFTKNNWNAKIMNYYLQNGYKDIIPAFIMERAEIAPDGDKFKFVKWKDEFGGNLWARYIGLPDQYDATNERDAVNRSYFHYSNTPKDGGHQITVGSSTYSWRPYSLMNENMMYTNFDYTAPRAPGDEASSSDFNTDYPRHDLWMSSAEINFYLAEFAIYGTNGLGNASDYFKKAVEQSVKVWDKMADKNHIPYYHETYGYSPDDVSIALQDGEVNALLARPDYTLTGNKADDLEKIFLNMEIHFLYIPVEHFVTARRSGIPKFGSNLIARVDYSANAIPVTILGRRPNFGDVSDADKMRDNIIEAYNRQGFTFPITDPRTTLTNTERLWQDVGAPQWGAGPNVGI